MMTVTFSLKHFGVLGTSLYKLCWAINPSKPKDSPSVVVNELLDSLDKLFDFGEIDGKTKKARDEWVHDRPFIHSVENFTGQKLPRSYSMDN